MPISPYVRQLRAHVGTMRLLLPSVSVHLFDDAGRLLLVRQREGDVWSTPGGLIEPDERPADAAVREAWEETGLLVRPDRVLGVYGGPECVVRYPNGDEVQYVITAVGATVAGGTPRPDGDETAAVQYWSQDEAARLPLAPWLRAVLPTVFAGPTQGAMLPPATWAPTRSTRVHRHVRAPRAAVYRLLLDPAAVARWKVPDGMTAQVHAFDPVEGGAIHVSLTYREPTGEGKSAAHTDTYRGRFLLLVPDERVVEIDRFETSDPDMRGEMTSTIVLSDAPGGGTDVVGIHEGIPPGVSIADNETGWRMALAKLAALAEADAAPSLG